jgi:hypothetical protein
MRKYPKGYKRNEEEMKLEDKKVKAVQAVNEVKAIQARQEEVKALFVAFDASEVKVQEALMNFKKSETVLESCEAFRVACVAVVEALKDKVFTSQKEVATELGFDKNKMSRIVKCGKVFQKFTTEELEAQGLNELDIKALSHDDPKVITNLLEDGAEVSEAKEAKEEAKAKAPSKKFEKAVETVIELLADASLSAEVRFDAYRRIEAQAGTQLKEEMKNHQSKKLEAYRQIVEGKKVKANA